MRRYVLRRLALALPTLGLVSVIVFSMMRLMPGDVVLRMVEGQAYAPTIEARAGSSGSTARPTCSTSTGCGASSSTATSASPTGPGSRSSTSSRAASR